MKNNYISLHLATSKLFFACILCFLLAGISTTANAQVTVSGCGAGNGDGSYMELSTAFTAINGKVQTGKNIIITLTAGYTTNNTATLNAGAWATLKIYPTVSNITITNSSNSLIILNGADNVTIDGSANQTGSTTDLSLITASQNSVSTIQFINSASSNTVKYCTLKGRSNNADCGIIHFSTDGTAGSGNDNNTIGNCNITSVSNTERPTYTIYSAGTSGKENTGNTISNNNFFNLWNPDRTSYGIYIASYSNSFTITGNNFYETTTAPSSGYSFSFVNILTGNGHSITNNYMGGSTASCGGTALSVQFPGRSSLVSFIPINLSVGTTAPATLVQGNTISNINFLSTVPEFSAIKVIAGNVDIIGNTIGASTGTQSIKITTDELNSATTPTSIINIASTGTINISNNTIGSIYTAQTSNKPFSLYGIYTSGASGTINITRNAIGSPTTINSLQASSTSDFAPQSLMGIYCTSGGNNTITYNTISGLTNSCIYYKEENFGYFTQGIGTTNGTNNISYNTINDIYGQMYLIGGLFQQSTSASQTVTYNTIYNIKNILSTTKNVGNYGICFDGINTQWSKVTNNYIYNLTVSSTSYQSSIDGIDLMSGKVYCYNNIVNLGENVTQPTMIYGIWDDGASTLTSNVYHNTIHINGTVNPSGRISKTCAYYRNANSSITTVNNNIFSNMRSGGTTGYNYAMYINANNVGLTINYNNYYVNIPTTRGMLGRAGGSDRANLSAIRTGTGQDAQSISTLPPFRQASTTLATDFKLTTQMAGLAGAMLTTVPDDYARLGIRSQPTMGAWEFKKNYWMGTATSTAWNLATNWTGKYIPSEDEDVEFADGTANTISPAAANHLLLDTDRKIRNLIINTNKRIEIPTGLCLDVTGTINTGGINNADRILIKADPLTTTPTGSLIFKNESKAVYGSVEMYTKSYLNKTPANEDDEFFWQYFGIPVESIKADPTFYGAYVRKANEAGDETDANYYWTELGNNDVLNAFDGYEICQPLDSKGLLFQGKLVNWDFSRTLIYSPGTNVKYPGQHLLANPYAAAINVTKINFGSDIDASVSLYTTGSYGQWSAAGNGVGDGTSPGQFTTIPKAVAGNNGLGQEVPSMSSMLVRVTSATPTNSLLSFNYKDVITKNTTLHKVKAVDALANTDLISTRIDLTGQHYSDRMWIFTEPSCTRNFDNGWDGRKMLGSSLAPQIYAMEPDGDYQVNSVSDMNNTDIAFQAGDEVEYTLKFTHENIQRQYAGVYLVDLIENKTVDVTLNGSTYDFATAQSDAPAKRFKILTRPYEKNSPDAEAQVKIFTAPGRIFIQNLSSLKGECTLYDIAGRAIKKTTFAANAVTEVLNNLTPGAYVATAITNGEKVSKRVIVQ
jgi:hypothetical protein